MIRTIVDGLAVRFALLVLALGAASGAKAYRPGQQQTAEVFQDCEVCPEMVEIPPGRFMMGTRERDVEAYHPGRPQHQVAIEYTFAVGVYEVTFDEWDACVGDGACGRYLPSDLGWGRANHPVINVSWEDAWNYVDWLTQRTGEEYRLLSEAEWEYVARAGTRTARYWGESDSEQCQYANGYDADAHNELERDHHRSAQCSDGWTFTAPVGSFRPNGFGLFDMLGNVREWVDDCFNASYEGAPTDGSSWQSGECSFPVLRGGSWLEHPELLYSSSRMRSLYGSGGSNNSGFRVARNLTPASAPQPPPDIQLGRLLVRLDRQISAERYEGVLQTLDRVLELHETHGLQLPEAFWRQRAEAALELGAYAEARASVALYLETVGRAGEQSAEALELVDRGVAMACTPERMTETLDSVESCLALGADPNGADLEGRTTLDWAAERQDPGIAAALRMAGADSALAASAAAEAKEAMSRPGTVFRDDCAGCPEMVVVPAGTFAMGSPAEEEGRWDDEGPRHQAMIGSPFAVGVYEVTFAEWEACIRAGGCSGYRPEDEGWGRGRRPVINVTWEDAQEYVRWLSQETGAEYRLLSEAEWEYAARADAQTARHWGESESGQCEHANAYDSTMQAELGLSAEPVACSDGYVYTSPVGRFRANAFGLHDVLGNVLEWTHDCWNENYVGAPTDGNPWQSGDCFRRVLRGGGWYYPPGDLRSAFRVAVPIESRENDIGFRVARGLP